MLGRNKTQFLHYVRRILRRTKKEDIEWYVPRTLQECSPNPLLAVTSIPFLAIGRNRETLFTQASFAKRNQSDRHQPQVHGNLAR